MDAHKTPDAVREAVRQGLDFVTVTLAFLGRDRGTDRESKTLDGLQEEARKLDPVMREALAALDSRAGDAGEEDGVPKGMKRAYVRCRAHDRVAHYDYVPYSFSTAVAVMSCGCDAKDAEQITREQFIAATPAPAVDAVPAGEVKA